MKLNIAINTHIHQLLIVTIPKSLYLWATPRRVTWESRKICDVCFLIAPFDSKYSKLSCRFLQNVLDAVENSVDSFSNFSDLERDRLEIRMSDSTSDSSNTKRSIW